MPRLLVLVLALLAAGCGGGSSSPDDADRDPRPAARKAERAEKAEQAAPPSGPTEFVTMTDPVQDAFTVDVPKGWDSQAYSTGDFDVHREVVTSMSPDGGTVLFIGDPKIPNYWNPATANEITMQMAELTDYVELEAYRPAGEYFPQYADETFGDLPGFEITSFAENPDVVEQGERAFAEAGLGTPTIHAVDINFRYEQDGKEMHGLLVGVTIDGGAFWQADVSGLSTDGDVEDYRPMLQTMASSKETNPEYTARMNAEHDRRMAQIAANGAAMTAQHNANMAAIQASAERHQARMDAIHSAGDASMAAFQDRMDAMDTGQRQFLNYINDEETVAAPGGQTYQVDNGYDRYWMKPDGTYLGGDINFDDQDIRAMGLDPSDYTEVQVTK